MHLDPEPWGIDSGYSDASGRWHESSPTDIDAVAAAMGAGPDQATPPEASAHTWCVGTGEHHRLAGTCELTLEDGTNLGEVAQLPIDLPLGYHRLAPVAGGPLTQLVVTPRRCHLPEELYAWGWAVQLYAARSRSSWGIGDLADLARLCRWSAGQGAGMIAVNPLHASGPALPQQASPYYPSSRRYRSPLYLNIYDVAGARHLGEELALLAKEGHALNDDRRIDRDRVWQLKADALARCYAVAPRQQAFENFLDEGGQSLGDFATYCAIAEVHGNGWQSWPAELRRPGSPAVEAFGARQSERVRFHAWLQWQLDCQLGSAALLPLVSDLAVGFDAGGADAWAWQDLLALDMRVGAPPDEFNAHGQDWGLPPFIPWKLRAAGYQPFIETLRAALRHAGGLRVDHVMGLFRLFWIPTGDGPGAGTYVRYPAGDLLDILALESHRAGAFVVGEDLGTVEEAVRRELADRAVLSYRLLWFEDGPPEGFPHQALAAVTTHDLPTIAGMWTGADLADQHQIGMEPSDEGQEGLRRRLAQAAGVGDGAAVDEVTEGAYRALARTPSRLVMATLDDALGVRERPNMPGTTHEWPNWSLALPKSLEDIEEDSGVATVVGALADGR